MRKLKAMLKMVSYLALLYLLLLKFLVPGLQKVWVLKLGLYLAIGFLLLDLLI